MKKTLLTLTILAAAALAGCASLSEAGHTGVDLKQTANGKCCDLSVRDGKEYGSRSISFTSTPAGSVTLTIQEADSKAFKGQAIGAKGLSVFPTTGLNDILSGQ